MSAQKPPGTLKRGHEMLESARRSMAHTAREA
jgi:hypothetical protein